MDYEIETREFGLDLDTQVKITFLGSNHPIVQNAELCKTPAGCPFKVPGGGDFCPLHVYIRESRLDKNRKENAPCDVLIASSLWHGRINAYPGFFFCPA